MNIVRKIFNSAPLREPSKTASKPESVAVKTQTDTQRSQDYKDELTYNWFGTERADSSVFLSPVNKRAPDSRDIQLRNRPGVAPENEGFDPYNTGHFEKTEK